MARIVAPRGFYQTMSRTIFFEENPLALGRLCMKHFRLGPPTWPHFERQAPMQKVCRKPYQRPQLMVHGPVESMTQHSGVGCSAPLEALKAAIGK
ncbi:MAG TPA: hypothetical protein VGF52_05960 [Tepidisphaeraceae bacterium]|jgi:hypothetical protein